MLCVTQIRLPSRSAIEKEVVWPGSSPAGACGIHCSVGPFDRLAVADPRPQPLDEGVGEDLGELLGLGIVVGDPDAGCEPDGAIDDVEMLHAVALELVEVEAIKDAQGQKELEALAGRRRHMHLPAAIGGGEWLAPSWSNPGEIGHGQRPALRLEVGSDRLAERALIEMARPLCGDVAQGRRELRLAQDMAERDARPAVAADNCAPNARRGPAVRAAAAPAR